MGMHSTRKKPSKKYRIFMRPIYFDYMATTPVDPRVAAKMLQYLTPDGEFGNASSRTHRYGMVAAQAVDQARQQVAALLNCAPDALIWTSGATEANNLAIKGAAHFYQRQGRHLVTCQTEHRAVLDVFAQLEREGFGVTYLPPQANGLVDLQQLQAALRPDTLLVSIMHANNEIGVVQDIGAIGEITRGKGVLLHVDAAQSAGKTPIDLAAWPVDLMSFSAHKVYGPKGIGALYIRQRPRLHLQPLVQGGSQEQGLRPGTLPVHQIVGMGEAFAIAQQEMAAENMRLLAFRQQLWRGLSILGDIRLHGDEKQRLAGNLNVSFLGIDAQNLLELLPDLALSTGSACTSGNIEPSHVLSALGLSPAETYSAIRFALGRFTTQQEVDTAVQAVTEQVKRLRARR
jgi:cysteine desulfurase